MANYLERVASSAARRTALARPPSSGPPLLPGTDLSLPAEGSPTSDKSQFFEAASRGTPEQREAETTSSIKGVTRSNAEGSRSAAEAGNPRDESPTRVDPVPGPSTTWRSHEPPFTIHLPKTLRPIAELQQAVDNKQHPNAVPAKPLAPHFTAGDEPIVQSSSHGAASESVTFAAERTSAHGEIQTGAPNDEHQPAPLKLKIKQTETETQILATEPRPPQIPYADSLIEATAQSVSQRDEPVPAAVLAVNLPPVATGNPLKQEESRITIGSLEVTVNNRPPVTPVRTAASAPLLNDKGSLERRYLDRFRLRR